MSRSHARGRTPDRGPVRVRIDRDSVAAGDDVDPHDHVVEVPAGTTLRDLLEARPPGVSVNGTWLIRIGGADGPWVGMHSPATGLRVLRDGGRLVADLPADGVYYDYWAGAPADRLLESLSAGHLPDRTELQHEGWHRRWQAEEQTAREQEAHTTARLLTPAATAAVAACGGRIEVHAPAYCRVRGADGEVLVIRTDRFWTSLSRADDDGTETAIASFGPPGPLAETTLVTRLAAAWRQQAGLADIERPPVDRTVEIGLSGAIWRWSWSDRDGLHEGRYWPDGALAATYAAYARMGVAEILTVFGVPSGGPGRR